MPSFLNQQTKSSSTPTPTFGWSFSIWHLHLHHKPFEYLAAVAKLNFYHLTYNHHMKTSGRLPILLRLLMDFLTTNAKACSATCSQDNLHHRACSLPKLAVLPTSPFLNLIALAQHLSYCFSFTDRGSTFPFFINISQGPQKKEPGDFANLNKMRLLL